MARAVVIYLEADFGKVGLHHHAVDGHIENIPAKEDDEVDLESDPVNPITDP